MSIGEFELIQQYFQREAGASGVSLGIGDDCALLQPPAVKQLAVSMDTLVADVHFPRAAEPALIAERALRVNLSDLAAMGAEPLWFTLGLTLPDADSEWLHAFSEGLFRVAREFHCDLVGGDTTCGPLSITIQVHGAIDPAQALLRSKAQPGDRIYVTGCLGDGAAALALIRGQLPAEPVLASYLQDRYYRPQPQLKMAAKLRGLAAAAIDISDGLLADLGHICNRSGVGASIDARRLPISVAVSSLEESGTVGRDTVLQWALSGGDDYQLCFTVPEAQVDAVEQLIGSGEIEARYIGDIQPAPETGCTAVRCYDGETELDIHKLGIRHTGYQHFENSGP